MESTLLEDLNEINGVTSHRLYAILVKLTDDEKAALMTALEGSMSAESIAATLTKHGHSVSATTIKRYRRLRERY